MGSDDFDYSYYQNLRSSRGSQREAPPHQPHVPRQPHPAHLWRHQRDHENPDRPDALGMASSRPSFDRRDLTGPFDIVGDVHGCCDELEQLLETLGYDVSWQGGAVTVTPPPGRTLIFVGDLVDRGPRTPDVLRIAMSMAAAGTALCVEGNHDNKFGRWLSGANVKTGHGLQMSIDQMAAENPAMHAKARSFIASLPPAPRTVFAPSAPDCSPSSSA